MEDKMEHAVGQEMGKVVGAIGGLNGRRPSRPAGRSLNSPRLHRPRDHKFSRRVAGVIAMWKSRSGFGPYASRSIANTAQEIVFPLSRIDRMVRDAIDADVPLHRVEALAYTLLDRIRELDAMKRRLKPAA